MTHTKAARRKVVRERSTVDGRVRRDVIDLAHGSTIARLFTGQGAAIRVTIYEASGDTVTYTDEVAA